MVAVIVVAVIMLSIPDECGTLEQCVDEIYDCYNLLIPTFDTFTGKTSYEEDQWPCPKNPSIFLKLNFALLNCFSQSLIIYNCKRR